MEALAKTGGLRGAGRVSISVLRTHMTALASAMTYVHHTALKEHVIIHRDLKPDNIGFTEDGTLKVSGHARSKTTMRPTLYISNPELLTRSAPKSTCTMILGL